MIAVPVRSCWGSASWLDFFQCVREAVYVGVGGDCVHGVACHQTRWAQRSWVGCR